VELQEVLVTPVLEGQPQNCEGVGDAEIPEKLVAPVTAAEIELALNGYIAAYCAPA
jgi:hypothetical protein